MALEQRLKDADDDDARLARNRKRIAFDRLPARLAATAPERWLLKGGVALELRLQDRARATKDVDLEWHIDEETLLDALIDATDHDAGDFFTFEVERAGPPPEQLGGAHRFKVSASLAGRPFEQRFALDVAPRNEVDEEAVQLTMPDLLGFAGIEPVTVAAIPLERHIAEKLHAYTQIYPGGRSSTRVKDLVDLALLADLATVDASALHAAIDATFDQRALHPLPEQLPLPPDVWRVPFGELARAVGIPTDLAAGHADAAALLDPILTGEVVSGTWSPGDRRWSHAIPAAAQSR
jgi:predicted nucleotidyltransferase component of viral defense system